MFSIDSVIQDGLECIAREQQETGGFSSLSSFNQVDFTGAVSYLTTFLTSIILSCLNAAVGHQKQDVLIDAVRSRAAIFLLEEKNKDWSFNYWSRRSKERETMPYPNDLDDTFNALAAIMGHSPKMINGEVLAAVAAILTSTETQEGGPYRTWLVESPSETWADVDLVVNSTIGYFLSCIDIHLPEIDLFIDRSILDGNIRSPYYPTSAHILYFISRFHKNRVRKNHEAVRRTIEAIEAFRNFRTHGMTPLENAMTITSLINLGAAGKIPNDEIKDFVDTIKNEGWKPYAFCMDPARQHRISYAGASALTAGLCVEALALWENTTKEQNIINRNGSTRASALHEKIIGRAKSDIKCTDISSELRATILREIDATTNTTITTLAQEFREVLGTRGRNIDPDDINLLALGNLYGWIAYDIYDNILDGEEDPTLLPAANFLLRTLTHIYEANDKKIPGCMDLFGKAMNAIDSANSWEQNHCKLPKSGKGQLPAQLPDFGKYRNLADRSIGHALGPLVELLILGCAPESKETEDTLSLFRHYLIAKQLHDDAHDWADDLLRGHINSVGAMVVKDFQNKNPDQAQATVKETLPVLREIFWKETIDAVVALICKHVSIARNARENSGLIAGTFFMEETLASLETSAKKTLSGRDDAILFLSHYHPRRP